MSQQNLQQRLDQDFKFAPSERPKRRRPIAATHRPVIAALALTASFIIAGLVYVSSYARVAQLEYRRQALVAEARSFEAANTQLRFDVEQARAQERVVSVAQQWGMALADPASEVDYIVLPPASGVTAADARRDAHPYAVLRDQALAQQVSSVITTGLRGAAEGAAGGQQMARP
ncbi:MAG: hypothetical protein JSV65_07140 [Armatimonadota bacterium]|nr:MAG: hypothetical protein JSV65_07140 [Armatimonadota bacterium]